jgi:hypothetical protein
VERERRHRHDQQGATLITSLLFLVLLTGLCVGGLATLIVNQGRSKNLLSSKQALYLADAGIQSARKYLNQHQSRWDVYASPAAQTLIAPTPVGDLGSYSVTVQDGGGGGVLVTATGVASNNATAAIKSLMVIGPYVPDDAVTVNEDLTISAEAVIAGTYGGVHANGNLLLSGSPVINTNATAGEEYKASGRPTVNGVAGGDQAYAAIPFIQAYSYHGFRDYLLAWDGNVYDRDGVVQPKVKGLWQCWKFSSTWHSQKWTLTCDRTVNGTLYFQTDVAIPTEIGTVAEPWIVTLLAEGAIEATARRIVARAPASADGALFKAGTQNFLFLTDEDMHIDGHRDQNLTGIVSAFEQFGIEGDPTMAGYIVAQDGSFLSRLVDENYISGRLALTYNGNVPNPLVKTVQSRTWIVSN